MGRPSSSTYASDVWIYDIIGNTWTNYSTDANNVTFLSSYPSIERAIWAPSRYKDGIIFFSGQGRIFSKNNDLIFYNITTNSFSVHHPNYVTPPYRAYHSMIGHGNDIYVLGGRDVSQYLPGNSNEFDWNNVKRFNGA